MALQDAVLQARVVCRGGGIAVWRSGPERGREGRIEIAKQGERATGRQEMVERRKQERK